MYSVERFEKEICLSEYMDKYVNVEEFLEYCKECPNYGRLWSCPPYDFDPLEIWGKYETLYVTARKIIFDEDKAPEDKDAMMSVLSEVKDHMSQELFEMERKFPGSISLSAGSCGLCRKAGCTRVCGEPCRYPDKMRYSIESLGGNVGLTVSKLMGIELEWMEEGKMPSYFVLAGGLLKQADRSKEGGSND